MILKLGRSVEHYIENFAIEKNHAENVRILFFLK